VKAEPPTQIDHRSSGLRSGRRNPVPQELLANGLVKIGAEPNIFVSKRNSAGTRLLKLICRELRELMLSARLISEEDFKAHLRRVDEQDFSMTPPMMWTVCGSGLERQQQGVNEHQLFIAVFVDIERMENNEFAER
jgi:hypothetical protein